MLSKIYRIGLFITLVLTVGQAEPERDQRLMTSLAEEIRNQEHPFKLLFRHEPLPEDPILPILLRNYFWPWSHMSPLPAITHAEDNVESPKFVLDDKRFQVNLNVRNFKPVLLKVKVSNGYVIVHGKSDDSDGKKKFTASHFVQRYALPQGSRPEEVTAELSSDGILTITVPRHQEVLQHKGLDIPIRETNEPFEKSAVTIAPRSTEMGVTENDEESKTTLSDGDDEKKELIKSGKIAVSDDEKKVKKKDLKPVKEEKAEAQVVLDNNTLDHTTVKAA